MGLAATIHALGAAMDKTTKSMGSMADATEALAPLIKQNLLDPLGDLQKLLDTFQGPALGFKQSFEKISKAVADGTMDINDAREAIGKLMSMMERFAMVDRRAGDPAKIQEIIQALERFLYEMSKKKGRP